MKGKEICTDHPADGLSLTRIYSPDFNALRVHKRGIRFVRAAR